MTPDAENPAIPQIEACVTDLLAAGADPDDVIDGLFAVAIALGVVLDRQDRVAHYHAENTAAGRQHQAAELAFEADPPRGSA